MSSTGRADVRHPDDFYITPEWVTRLIVPRLPRPCCAGIVVDAGCGEGAIGKVLTSAGYSTVGVELNEARAATANAGMSHVIVGNFLAQGLRGYRGVVMNSPFSLAMPFLEHALEGVESGGFVVSLLRLSWLASQKRAAFHKAHQAHVMVLPKRPSFTADGKTDSADYAWFGYGRGFTAGKWEVL